VYPRLSHPGSETIIDFSNLVHDWRWHNYRI